MRIAFFARVRANLPALTAAWDAARRAGADETMVLGDVVGGGPHPDEVCALLRKRGATVLRGATEAALAGDGPLSPDLEWTRRAIDPRHLRWLLAPPTQRRFVHRGRLVILASGTPPATTQADLLVHPGPGGPTVSQGPPVRVRPGAVGDLPQRGPAEAEYVLADLDAWTFEVRHAAYDADAVRSDLEEAGLAPPPRESG